MNQPAIHCILCGYNLTGLPENRCPECGEPFDPDEYRWRKFNAEPAFSWPAVRMLIDPTYYLWLSAIAVAVILFLPPWLAWPFLLAHTVLAAIIGVDGIKGCTDKARRWATDDRYCHSAGSSVVRSVQATLIFLLHLLIFMLCWLVGILVPWFPQFFVPHLH